MADNIIILADRIKELSYTTGSGNFALAGAANGFSSFGSKYNHQDNLFYAITDGTRYEIGSGVYLSAAYNPLDGITENQIIRFPFRSSNNNSIVNFPAGTKEVYVTYPATHSVYTGSGVSDLSNPNTSGISFWASPNVLDYDNKFIWDKDNTRLGIAKPSPSYAIDIGGISADSIIRASGFIVNNSGVIFPSGNNGDSSYIGGVQLAHFNPNRLDQYAVDNLLLGELTGTDSVFELSGVVNEYILFKKQNAGTVLAGPPSGCVGPCSPAYPSFRQLVEADYPFLAIASGALNSTIIASGTASNNLTISVSGILSSSITNSASGINQNLAIVSGIAITASGANNAKIDTVSGILNNKVNTLETNVSNSLLFLENQIDGIDATVTASAAGSGIVFIESNKSLNLDDPTVDYSSLTSSNSAFEDKVLVWRESNNRWYNMPLGDLLYAPSGNSYIKQQTINNTSDAGQLGQITYDDDYIYFYTSVGWKRIGNMQTFGALITTTSTTTTPDPLITTTTTSTTTTSSPFNRSLTILSGNTNISGAGLTFYGPVGSSLEFNEVTPITNPLNISEIRIYIGGTFSYRITLFTEIVAADGAFRLTTNTSAVYNSTFGSGTVVGSYRRIDF